ncbi:MAG: hypothetical protein ACE5JA_09225, partial [bacterium]
MKECTGRIPFRKPGLAGRLSPLVGEPWTCGSSEGHSLHQLLSAGSKCALQDAVGVSESRLFVGIHAELALNPKVRAIPRPVLPDTLNTPLRHSQQFPAEGSR